MRREEAGGAEGTSGAAAPTSEVVDLVGAPASGQLDAFAGGGAGVESPWVESYRSEILLRTRCQDHEMFDQPVAMVLVAASTDDNPVRCAPVTPAFRQPSALAPLGRITKWLPTGLPLCRSRVG